MKQKEAKRPSWKLWVAAGGIILLCVIGFGVWMGPSILFGDKTATDGGPSERAALVTVDDFELLGHSKSEIESEHCYRRGDRSLFGSIHLSYFYICGGLAGHGPRLRIRSSAFLFDYALLGGSDMSIAYWQALSKDFNEQARSEYTDTPAVTWRRLDEFKLGDESICALAFDGEKPVGFSFRCLVGERLLDVSVQGWGFADSAAIEAFLAPQVAQFREYVP